MHAHEPICARMRIRIYMHMHTHAHKSHERILTLLTQYQQADTALAASRLACQLHLCNVVGLLSTVASHYTSLADSAMPCFDRSLSQMSAPSSAVEQQRSTVVILGSSRSFPGLARGLHPRPLGPTHPRHLGPTHLPLLGPHRPNRPNRRGTITIATWRRQVAK